VITEYCILIKDLAAGARLPKGIYFAKLIRQEYYFGPLIHQYIKERYMDTVLFVLILIGGLVTFLGAVLNWTWIYRSKRSKSIVSTLGLTGARIFYGIVGLGLMILSVLSISGFFDS
jgi:hypothetical protein